MSKEWDNAPWYMRLVAWLCFELITRPMNKERPFSKRKP